MYGSSPGLKYKPLWLLVHLFLMMTKFVIFPFLVVWLISPIDFSINKSLTQIWVHNPDFSQSLLPFVLIIESFLFFYHFYRINCILTMSPLLGFIAKSILFHWYIWDNHDIMQENQCFISLIFWRSSSSSLLPKHVSNYP